MILLPLDAARNLVQLQLANQSTFGPFIYPNGSGSKPLVECNTEMLSHCGHCHTIAMAMAVAIAIAMVIAKNAAKATVVATKTTTSMCKNVDWCAQHLVWE